MKRIEIIEYKTKGCIIRSKTIWYNEGEKNSKYFLGLEKRHYNQKTIRYLKIDDNSNINSDQEILKEAKRYYKSLYTTTNNPNKSNSYDNNFFSQENKFKISEHEKEQCEGLLTIAECLESLKEMASNKSAGTDGLPAEFYSLLE